ncbi:MAG TPA: GPW/gp25 family protein [Pyrinomonadaceae bacterium]|nr:GPW/gp25 family protein [Pyrinomonadaceae bacterium]
MNIHGSTIQFPFQADRRGSTATTDDRQIILSQAIADIIETRQGERVMMPDYGFPDFVFAVQDFSFAPRLAFYLEEQILKYVPLIRSVKVKAETDEEGRAIVSLSYEEVGSINAPKNLVFPVWQYLGV